LLSTQIWVKWTNLNVGLKMQLENVQLKGKVEVELKFEIIIIFNPTFGFVHWFKQPSIV